MSEHWIICLDRPDRYERMVDGESRLHFVTRTYVRRCYPTQTTEQRSGALIFASKETATQYLPQVRQSLPDAKIVRVIVRAKKLRREAILGLLAECYGELRTIEALTVTSSDMDGLMVLLARVRDALAEREEK